MTSERETPLEVANELPYTRAIRWLGAGGGILALLCTLSGVAMLVLKWVDAHPPAVMSQVPLVLFPVAFIALMLALLLAVLRRKSSLRAFRPRNHIYTLEKSEHVC